MQLCRLVQAHNTLELRLRLHSLPSALWHRRWTTLSVYSPSSLFIDGLVGWGTGQPEIAIYYYLEGLLPLSRFRCTPVHNPLPPVIGTCPACPWSMNVVRQKHVSAIKYAPFPPFDVEFEIELVWICISAISTRTPAVLITGRDEINEADTFFTVSV